MTEKQFWEAIEKSLSSKVEQSEAFKDKFMKRLRAALIANADELIDLKGDKRKDFIKRLFRKAGFNNYWRLVLDGFDTRLDFQNKYWDENTTAQTGVSRNNERLLALEEIRFEKFGQLGEKGVAAVDKSFTEAVKKNLTRAELVESLQAVGGKVGSFAGAIADTSLRGWDRSVTDIKATIAGIEKATFDGPPPIESSHDFCIENYQQTFTRDEIDGLINGNLEPPRIYGGGYRCRHGWRWKVRKILKNEK